MTEKKELSTEI